MKPNHTTETIIISSDTRLRNILINSSSAKADRHTFLFATGISELASLPPANAYVLDIDLANSSIDDTTDNILKLNQFITDKPLLLIGKPQGLDEVLSNPAVKGVISRTVSKPLSYGQLQLAITAVNAKPSKHNNATKTALRPRPIAVACLILAAVLITAFSLLQQKEISPTADIKRSLNPVSNRVTTSVKAIPSGLADSQAIAQLNRLALSALEEGRLTTPKNHNAWFYLTQLEALDSYNAVALLTRKELFSLLETRYQESLKTANSTAIENALLAIVEVEPYNEKYLALLSNARPNNKKAILVADATIPPLAQYASTDQIQTSKDSNQAATENTMPAKNVKKKQGSKSKESVIKKEEQHASVNKTTLNKQLAATIKPAIVLKHIEASYPRHAATLNYEGWVEIEYQVDVNGQATNIQITRGERIKTFENSAIKALQGWAFSPSVNTVTNETVMSEPMVAKFEFNLDG